MAFTQQQHNWLGRQLDRAAQIRALKQDIEDDKALYDSLDFSSAFTNQGFIDEGLPWLTQSHIWNLVGAEQAIVDTLDANGGAHELALVKVTR